MTRDELNGAIRNVHTLSLSSYQVPSAMTSARATLQLSKAIQDATRTDQPNIWNGLLLQVIAPTAKQLATKLSNINQTFDHPVFSTAEQHANSAVELELDKFTVYDGQSLEWTSTQTVYQRQVADWHENQSLSLVDQEGKDLVTSVDAALTDAANTKARRDQRLQPIEINKTQIAHKLIMAGNRKQLAQTVSQVGNNDEHWCFVLFVGEMDALNIIKEVIQ